MFGFFRRIFFKPKRTEAELTEELLSDPGSGLIGDEDFGLISYFQPSDQEDGIWQMEDEWENPDESAIITCTGIPGNIHGPYKESRDFLLSKRQKLDQIWALCQKPLLAYTARWSPGSESANPKDIYWLSTMALNDSSLEVFEVGFESKEDHPLGQIYFEITDGKIINNESSPSE